MRRKFAVIVWAVMLLLLVQGAAFAIVYGKAGYESQGYSEATAWEIDSAAVLAKVRDDVNSKKVNYTAYYKLTKDIDLTGYSSWTPIGGTLSSVYKVGSDIDGDDGRFRGHFDGCGHTIKVNIQDLATDRKKILHGLFGLIIGGSVKNLNVEGNIECFMRGDVADIFVGGIVSYLGGGSIENCTFNGKVTAANQGQVSVKTYAGGIVARAGYSYYTVSIKNCKVGNKSDTAIPL